MESELEMNQSINDYIIHFLLRKASAEDVQELKKWLDADPAHRDELKQWFKAWDAADMADNAGRYRPEEAYQRFMFRLKRDALPKTNLQIMFRNIRRIAAILVIGVSTSYFAYLYLSQLQSAEIAFVENIIPLGSKSEIKLPDGSTVWLNAGSKLRYPTDYGKTTRNIYLEGEGYFKVAKQAEKPFIVHTYLMRVTALGTEFNIRAYPDETVTETMLVSGKVLIDNSETDAVTEKPVELKPGEKYSLSATSGRTETGEHPVPDEEVAPEPLPAPVIKQLPQVIVDAEVSWKESNWRIEREELQSLAVKLERRYDVRITIDERLKTYRFSGTLKDESLEQVLTAMKLSSPILFSVKGKDVFIHIDKRKLNH
jgi:ferric-dicitrate binding protein FerR (iron transport regulator)